MNPHAEGNPNHPFRSYTEIREVPNRWDHQERAYQVTLECGHICYLTGHSVFNLTGVHCKTCAGKVT